MKTNSKQFLALQAKWDKKLKDSGFQDAEQRDGNLKRWSLDKSVFQKERDSAKEEYYRLAGHFLYDHAFLSEQDRLTWELHAEGKAITTIVGRLKNQGFLDTNKEKAHQTIKRLAKIMVEQWKAPKE